MREESQVLKEIPHASPMRGYKVHSLSVKLDFPLVIRQAGYHIEHG
jgi:hypothetical protein